MSTIFKLIIEDDEGKTTVYPLVEGEVSIGRKEGNTIRLMERNVSRRHARLVREAESVSVEDLDSYNGVRVNGERIGSRHPVREGDLIEIGDYHLALRRTDGRESEDTMSLEDTQTLDEGQGGAAPAADGWPPGTVPDFPLPEDLLSSARLPHEGSIPTDVGFSPASDLALGGADESAVPAPPFAPEDPTTLPPFPAPSTVPSPPRARATTAPTRPPAAANREPPEPGPPRAREPGPAVVESVSRLICVSTQHAGRVFRLDRPDLVIGREGGPNHIVIDHRSVSRNHAKIQFDGRTHKIIDLHSSNGIVVNGDEYTMTHLRSGDLIELGLVRFRFVPAGERFEPEEEEAREMRRNGVEPPGPPDRARTVPANDPSVAATVTDAPRRLADTALTVTRPANGHLKDTLPDNTAAWRNRVAVGDPVVGVPAGAAHHPDERSSTALTSVLPPAPAELSGSGRRIGPGLDYRTTMIGLIVVLSGLVCVLLVLLTTRGDPRHDLRLEELINQRNYAGAISYYQEHEGDFDDPEKSMKLSDRARTMIEASPPRESPDPRNVVTVEPSPGRMGAAQTLRTAMGTAEPSPRPVRARAARPSAALQRLNKLASDAEAALLAGELERADRVLRECLRRNSDFAICHRHMAVVQANLKRNRKAVLHYRRYLELAPNAPDAPKVREILDAFEKEAQRP